jgi:thiol-disulfide isomerase/thioredoxin
MRFARVLALLVSAAYLVVPVVGADVDSRSSPGPRIVPAGADEILEVVRERGTAASLINVWATWCVPCREEFPDLMRLHREHGRDGMRLILVSADFDDAVDEARAFLASQGVTFTTYLKTGKDQEFIDSLSPEWTGALPASFIYDSEGRLRDFWQGRISHEDMEQRLLAVMRSAGRAGNTED